MLITPQPLDAYLLDSEHERGRRLELVAAREEPSLAAFLPRRGDGMLSLSASDLSLSLTSGASGNLTGSTAIQLSDTSRENINTRSAAAKPMLRSCWLQSTHEINQPWTSHGRSRVR